MVRPVRNNIKEYCYNKDASSAGLFPNVRCNSVATDCKFVIKN